jgi:hypothetical protein
MMPRIFAGLAAAVTVQNRIVGQSPVSVAADQDGVVAATDATTVSVTVPTSKISAGAIFEAKFLQGNTRLLSRQMTLP